MVVQSAGGDAYPTAQKYYEAALKGEPTRARAALGLSRIYLPGRVAEAGHLVLIALAAQRPGCGPAPANGPDPKAGRAI